jgi:peptide deformylase
MSSCYTQNTMIRDILIWPDKALLQISKPVEVIDDSVRTLLADLLETMYANDGVGLAAPQIGVHVRALVVDIHSPDAERLSGEEPIQMINPVFLEKRGALTWNEGCLSVPGENAEVERASYVRMSYLDEKGMAHELEAEGLMAVALQHECDHLDGKLFVDYVHPLKRKLIRKRMLKLRNELGFATIS